MIDKYKVLNNEEIQFYKYNEVKTDNTKMKNIMKSKLKSRKQTTKKLLAASVSAVLILGTVALTNETTWAYINLLAGRIESFLDRDYSEFDKYKFEGNQSITDNGLVLNLGDVMLDDGQLIISLSMDYTNFDFKKHGVDKKDFMPDIPIITIGDISFPGQGGGINPRDVKNENKKEFLYTINLNRKDTDGDGIGDTDIDLLDSLEKDKDYNLKIQFKDFDLGESKTEKGRLLFKTFGNWEFNTTINTSNISNDLKVVNVNKYININDKVKLKIDQIKVSPISVNIKTQLEGNKSEVARLQHFTDFYIEDESGNSLLGGNSGSCSKNDMYYHFELKGSEKKIIITPGLFIPDTETKYFEDEKIEIDIPQLNTTNR